MPRSVVSWCCWGPSLPHWWLSGSPRAPRETAAYGPSWVARCGLARASILLGLIWGSWHLPQFFIPEADTYGQSFFVYVLQVTALSVAMAWLYARTNGSLLLVMLLHAAVNNAKDIVPSALPGANSTFGLDASLVAWLTVTLLWICAAYFLAGMPKWDARGDLTDSHR